ncbi:MAG: HD domain-containing protein [Verrucomicrobia bacterium]|nr:HD domain-containing protein [Verrucomicrobiota bacterium]
MGRSAYVKDLAEGMAVSEVFVLESKSLGTTKSGKPYLTLMLRDRTGRIETKVWDEAEAINTNLAGAQFVHVNGSVESFNNRLQLKAAHLAVKREQDVVLDELMATSARDSDDMLDELKTLARTVKNAWLRKLLAAFFADESFVARFKVSPAAKTIHQSYVGGLIEHTLSVVKIAATLADHYSDLNEGRGLNRDLLITGAVLHDIGKIAELESGVTSGYTTPGQLIGHIVLGYRMVEEKIERIDGFPQELRDQIGHLVLSHQGRLEWKSPVVPLFTEAVLLHYIDDLDAKVQHVAQAIANVRDPEAAFTDWDRVLDRFFYTRVEQGKEV